MFEPVNPAIAFPALEEWVLQLWRDRKTFAKSLELRAGRDEFVFYEGPPTANGRPGVHHVQARAYKDLFPRYKTMRGYRVARKAGWDCHGLPVEIEVEKQLGFSGKKAIEDYGIEPFNARCRASVMEYEGAWREMTERIGFWVDLDGAYMTMSNEFVESVWWSLKQLWNKDLLYLGYKVVPYCAQDGTPLSSHEVGLGYQDVRDPSIFVRFPLTDPASLGVPEGTALLVWTTTPWTLPGNTGAAVHPELDYVVVDHGGQPLLLAASLVKSALQVEEEPAILARLKGHEVVGALYQAPYTYFDLNGKGHRVVPGSFVSAEDGTGIVHLAPAFGADDLQMSRDHGLPVVHAVDPSGHFVPEVELLAGHWFKSADSVVIKDLKQRGLLFRKAEYLHAYPHCWRCRQPLMYYATDSWFIRNTSLKNELIAKNQEIDWHPAHIQTGRYGDWLNNLVDWALSRTRYWGTPLPIWVCTGCGHKDCLGSFAELAERSRTPLDLGAGFDPHRPYVDRIQLTCGQCGAAMERVPDVIDCWYDSGSMPFAQLHYPFENQERFEATFPADFICEGLDQTRGWFNSLHQLGVMLFDRPAYRTVICHGLVLDGQGEKMSKSRGNVVDPWEVLNTHGADSLRWYLYASAPPEVSRRFSVELVGEACRRYLLTLWNTYYFFILNAESSGCDLGLQVPWVDRPDIDRWVLSRLHQVTAEITERMDAFELTPAARALQDFVDELSNWYVRRNRRRFWVGDQVAYLTLFECLETVCRLTAPFTPFIAETIYQNLRRARPDSPDSVHLCDWPVPDPACLDQALLDDSALVMKVVSIGRAARNLCGHRTRQPLQEALVGTRSASERAALERFSGELMDELNVKSVRFLDAQESFLQYDLKPNLPVVGRKWGKLIPAFKAALQATDGTALARRVQAGETVALSLADGSTLEVTAAELLIEARSPEGFTASEEGGLLVALNTDLTPELLREGTARDLTRHIQELRKQSGLEIGDRIQVWLVNLPPAVEEALAAHRQSIADEVLASSLESTTTAPSGEGLFTSTVSLAKDAPAFAIFLAVARQAGRVS